MFCLRSSSVLWGLQSIVVVNSHQIPELRFTPFALWGQVWNLRLSNTAKILWAAKKSPFTIPWLMRHVPRTKQEFPMLQEPRMLLITNNRLQASNWKCYGCFCRAARRSLATWDTENQSLPSKLNSTSPENGALISRLNTVYQAAEATGYQNHKHTMLLVLKLICLFSKLPESL